jgi:MoaA/NifB/PqqE/SkfB family radical SAM enzyme
MPREKPPVHGSGFRDRLALTFMPGVLDKVRRNFRDIDYAQALVRAFDDRPLQCSLYVTDQCNLDCSYCTEYDNSVPHPSLAQLERWVRKIRELGTERIALVGGEPLMHPDIVALVRFCKRLGMSTSLTTNGFLLTRELVAQLAEAGLDVMQISIDRVTPSPVTKKSLKTVERKVALLKDSPIKLHLTGVICGDTLDECEQVLAFGLSRDIPTEIRLVHAGPDGLMRVDPGARERARAILERMIEQKQRGEKIHTTRALHDYQLGLLEGRDMTQEWVCAAGYKLFFVSARGKFYECSMRHTERDLLDMTLADLAPYHARKACQNGCGVYCVVGVSLFRDNLERRARQGERANPVRAAGERGGAAAEEAADLGSARAARAVAGPNSANRSPAGVTCP